MQIENINKNQIKIDRLWELKRLFPEYFDKDGKFLIEKFTNDIEREVDISKESYSLEWLGKSYAQVLATEPIRTLLKENREFNEQERNINSENILIKGDNLEVLKHLFNAYENMIKMIYIDPPYNTKDDEFVYSDNRKFTPKELAKLGGITVEKAKRVLNFINSKSNSHSAWLTFIYPRLYLAKRLLKEDGAIFVSIDDNELAQLKLLMDDIFGEENFIGTFVRKTGVAARLDANNISIEQDYILCYSKTPNINFNKQETEIEVGYIYKDEYYNTRGKYKLNKLDRGSIRYSSSLDYPITSPDGTIIYPGGSAENNGWCWRWSKEKVDWGIKNGFIEFKKGKKGEWKVYFKQYQYVDNSNNPLKRSIPFKSLLIENYNNEIGSKEILKLFNKKVFSYPKPTTLIKFLINLVCNSKNSDIILDFFAGSGTTADAIMQLNAQDGGDRRFILVQLDEKIEPKKCKVAYDFIKNELKKEIPTIYDITKERVLRAAKKIVLDKSREIEEIKGKILTISTKQTSSKRYDKKLLELKELLKQKVEALNKVYQLDFGFKEFETIPLPEENLKEVEELEDIDLFKVITDSNALLTTWKLYDGIKLDKNFQKIDFDGYVGYYLDNKLYLVDKGFKNNHLFSIFKLLNSDNEFMPYKIVINGYSFDSKTQREIYENINNFNKKDLDKIELVIRY